MMMMMVVVVLMMMTMMMMMMMMMMIADPLKLANSYVILIHPIRISELAGICLLPARHLPGWIAGICINI